VVKGKQKKLEDMENKKVFEKFNHESVKLTETKIRTENSKKNVKDKMEFMTD
jgi:hypothetical protein